jgi:hypothetical protein
MWELEAEVTKLRRGWDTREGKRGSPNRLGGLVPNEVEEELGAEGRGRTLDQCSCEWNGCLSWHGN